MVESWLALSSRTGPLGCQASLFTARVWPARIPSGTPSPPPSEEAEAVVVEEAAEEEAPVEEADENGAAPDLADASEGIMVGCG